MSDYYIDDTLTPEEVQAQLRLKESKPLVYEKMIRYNERISKGQSVANIQIQYGYQCNMKCIHCSIQPFQKIRNRRKLTLQDVANLSKQADELGLANITVSGGEPTLYKDFDGLIAAINPAKFWIQVDTNGWLFNDKLAKHWKSIGVDKIDLSLDSLNEQEHDDFRRKPGAWKRAVKAIDYANNAGISVLINTVVTHSRMRSPEFIQFLDFLATKNVATMICWGKPVGGWFGHYEDLATPEDADYLAELCKKYRVFDHTTLRSYGRHMGCMAVKRLIGVTQFGDAMACPWLQLTLGNVIDTPLKDILEKGMKYFGNYEPLCLIGTHHKFIKKYVSQLNDNDVTTPIENIIPINWQETIDD
jgi:MoaA/NifB/PqqE/SkfB family radical SAM enzyme